MHRWTPLGLAVPVTFALASCGGAGAVESTPAAPPATSITPNVTPATLPTPVTLPSNSDFETKEYLASNAAVASNAIGAWQMGATGKGITIGFIDTGLVPIRTDFTGKIHSDSRDVVGSRPMDDTWGHGTAVAGIAAGAKDDRGMHGVAFDSIIFMAKADQGCPDRCTFSAEAIARGIDAAIIAGARVINLSIGGLAASEVEGAARRAAAAGIVLVVGSGNSGTAPSDFAQRLAKVAPNNVIIVGALGTASSDIDTIVYDSQSGYSTPASSAKENYLGAPGLYNAATYFRSDGIDRLSGSSFAAPVVSGALALLAQAFPTLSGESLIRILYTTADDLGAYGIDEVFGQGRLNIGRAFQPIGAVRIAGTDIPVRAHEVIVAPAASGDAVYLNGLETVVLDSFGRAFPYNVSSATLSSRGPNPLASLLTVGQRNSALNVERFQLSFLMTGNAPSSSVWRNFDVPFQSFQSAHILASSAIARLSPRTSIAMGYKTSGASLSKRVSDTIQSISLAVLPAHQYGLASDDIRSAAIVHQWKSFSLSAAGERGIVSSAPGTVKNKRYFIASGALIYETGLDQLRVGLSRTEERRTLLGSDILALFGGGGSSSRYFDAGLSHFFLEKLAFSINVRIGRHDTSVGILKSRAVSVELSRSGIATSNDQLILNISQPLRIESGKLSRILPTSWDYYTKSATYSDVALNMEPSGRELKAEIGYARDFSFGHFIGNGFVRRQPDHVKNDRADVGLALRGRLIF